MALIYQSKYLKRTNTVKPV